MSDAVEKGLAIFAEVYGKDMGDAMRQNIETDDNFSSVQARWAMEFPFGQVWTREERLSRRDRSLAVLGMCISQRAFEEIRYHTIMGVANGLTRAEIEEVFLTSIPYCGFPAANTAKDAILEGFKELEAAGKL